jgi:hypothetical protein
VYYQRVGGIDNASLRHKSILHHFRPCFLSMPTRSTRRQASDALEQAFLVNLIAELEAQEYESFDSDSDSSDSSSDDSWSSSSSSSDDSDEEITAADD